MTTPSAPNNPDDETLTELARLEAAATPGPWHLEQHWDDVLEEQSPIVCGPNPRGVPRQGLAEVFGDNDDAEFIVAARNALPALLAALAETGNQRARAEAAEGRCWAVRPGSGPGDEPCCPSDVEALRTQLADAQAHHAATQRALLRAAREITAVDAAHQKLHGYCDDDCPLTAALSGPVGVPPEARLKSGAAELNDTPADSSQGNPEPPAATPRPDSTPHDKPDVGAWIDSARFKQFRGSTFVSPGPVSADPPVHNHGTEDGPGLACRESRVDGRLRGDCLAGPSEPEEKP